MDRRRPGADLDGVFDSVGTGADIVPAGPACDQSEDAPPDSEHVLSAALQRKVEGVQPVNQKPGEVVKYFEPQVFDGGSADLSETERCALEAVNRRVAGAGTLGELLDLVLAETSGISPCDRLSVAFVEPGDRVVSHTTRANYSPLELAPGYSEGLAGSSLAEVIESGKTRVIPDLETYARQHPASRSTKRILAEGIASSMTCPLSVDGRNVGLFWRSSKQKNAYDRHQVMLHLAVVERLSQAVEKAYRIEQLASASAAYAEMLGFVSHELQSPVASIMTDANLILSGYLGEVGEKHREKLNGMLRKGEFLLALVRDYLNLARVDAGALSVELSEVRDFAAEVVHPAIELVRAEIEKRGQQADAGGGPRPARGEMRPGAVACGSAQLREQCQQVWDRRRADPRFTDARRRPAAPRCLEPRARFPARTARPTFPTLQPDQRPRTQEAQGDRRRALHQCPRRGCPRWTCRRRLATTGMGGVLVRDTSRVKQRGQVSFGACGPTNVSDLDSSPICQDSRFFESAK